MARPEAQLQSLIARLRGGGDLNQSHVTELMMEVRQILEKRNKKEKFPILNLYCNWIAHIQINKSKIGYQMLYEITEIIAKHYNTTDTDAMIREISKVFSLEDLRRSLLVIFKEISLPTFLFDNHDNWHAFLQILISKLLEKGIELPNPATGQAKEWEEKIVAAGACVTTPHGKGFSAKRISIIAHDGKAHWNVEIREIAGTLLAGPLHIADKETVK
ncbi:MAG: hypothetical protein AB1405_15775 [Bdellovibrionota bacterium]